MKSKRLFIFIAVIILLALLSIYLTEKEKWKNYERETCFVNRIIDGDTLVCDNETIRLLGIDTPEKGEEYFDEATDYLSIVDKKEIEILRDWDNHGKYNRKLRYIFYEDRLINIELIEQGLAIAFMIDDLKYEEELINVEKLAKESCIRIWEETC